MDQLKIEKGTSTPEVDFNPETGTLGISGESYPENSFEFYAPLLAWLRGFLPAGRGPVTMRVELEYLNTSSTKCMIDLLDELESAYRSGRPVSVVWYYDSENERAKDTIEEFREDFEMPFSIVGR